MLHTRRRALLHALRDSGADLAGFDLDWSESELFVRPLWEPEYHLTATPYDDLYGVNWYPSRVGGTRSSEVDEDGVRAILREWIDAVAAEHEAFRDVEALLAGDGTLVEATDDDEPLTAEEQQAFVVRLDQAEQLAASWDLEPAQLEAVSMTLGHLRESADRVSRKDLKLMIGGAVLGLAMDAIGGPLAKQLLDVILGGVRLLTG